MDLQADTRCVNFCAEFSILYYLPPKKTLKGLNISEKDVQGLRQQLAING